MPENASSSQNANQAEQQLVVASLTDTGKGGFFLLRFSGYEPVRLLRDIVRKADIGEGSQISESFLGQLREDNQAELAKRAGLDILARRAHPEKELRTKLAKKDFTPEAINRAVARLSELGYVDDAAYCRNWIMSRLSSKKFCRMEMYRKLTNRGISREIAGKTLGQLLSRETEVAHCRNMLESLLGKSGVTEAKAVERLARRGFAWPVIKRALRPEDET